jgi:hypothetical protein
MSSPNESPFREPDLQGVVERLRAERAALVGKIGAARKRRPGRGEWSWGMFLLGVLAAPLSIAACGAFAFWCSR